MTDARPEPPSPRELAELPADGGDRWNRLVFESSPYLLQHAANPVNWRPWGEQAFAAARAEDKPVFLSIGYATCHWCHVMERESFEDAEVAEALNRSFVCVKVDKEERPDIDDIYMTACQALTGHGGWPLTVLLDHDKRPFFTGTYFPKHGRHGRPGMMELIPRVAQAWATRRPELLESAGKIVEHIQKMSGASPGQDLDEKTLDRAFEQLANRYDEVHGGFGERPKFPTPHNFLFLLRHWRRTGDEQALEMSRHSLRSMRLGGLFDHIGFGFHRYSTDAHWLLPHFEKMLYDQALLAMAFVEAHLASGDVGLAEAASEIFSYTLRDLKAPEGGFYCAEDADSEGVEGKFYVWTPRQAREILGEEEGSLFCRVFQVVEEGNFREEATGHTTGDSIPHLVRPLAETAAELGMDANDLRARADNWRQKLFEARERRVRPLKDDKVLTDWNGLMIAALAKGGRALAKREYVEAAGAAADFILSELRDEHGRLLKRWRNGKAGLAAHLDDYAFTIWGLVELYQADFNPRWLAEALALAEWTLDHFHDAQSGAFFLTADEGEQLIMRSLNIYDGATPSGNSAMALNLARLARLTGQTRLEEAARAVIRAFAGQIESHPSASSLLMCALDFLTGPTIEIVIAGERGTPDTEAMIATVNRSFLPNAVSILRQDAHQADLAKLAPYTANQSALGGRATAYFCRNFTCDAPIRSPESLRKAIDGAVKRA